MNLHQNICCVFTCDNLYLDAFKKSVQELISNGGFTSDVILMIGEDLEENDLKLDPFFIDYNIKIIKFKKICFSNETKNMLESIIVEDKRNLNKKFQWHKLNIFNVFFKKWDYVLYLDCGMKIHQNITPILNLKEINRFIAHSDNYPDNGWNLNVQFDNRNPLYIKLASKYNLNIDYPQTGLMLFHTEIINETLFYDLLKLVDEFPITRTNEQAYVALYFTNIKKIWKKMPIGDENQYFYNALRINKDKNYIITKYN